jgi:hypothetical protein
MGSLHVLSWTWASAQERNKPGRRVANSYFFFAYTFFDSLEVLLGCLDILPSV